MVTSTSIDAKATGIKLKNELDRKEPTLVVKTKPRVKLRRPRKAGSLTVCEHPQGVPV